MRYIFTLTLLFFVSGLGYAADNSSTFNDNSKLFSKGFSEQEQISDTKLHKTVEMIKERALTKKQRKNREEIKPLSPAYDEEHLENFTREDPEVNEYARGRTVMIPVRAYDENGTTIQPGYYKLSCRQISKDEYVLDLSQGSKVTISVKAIHTTQDLEQEEINFCNSEIISNGRIRLMYGSIDLNLVGYIYFEE